MGTVVPQLTCLNCRISFKSADLQREHYKTDWHRYNLKRNVSELPPITAEEYQRRVQLLRAENETMLSGKSRTYCVVCKKSFSSDRSFENHLRSKKHINGSQSENDDIAQPSIKNNKLAAPIAAAVSAPSTCASSDWETDSSGTEELDSDEWDEIISENNPILSNNCLFCTHHSASFGKNVRHMSAAHSFFLPYAEYLVDMEGLLMYLGEKICQGMMCIWCSDKKNSFSSIEAVRNHMIDKGHTKIPFDTDASLEYLDFYDFELDVNEEEEGENNGDDNASVIVEKPATQCVDDENTVATMLLPSGEVICHRSLMRYFRQNIGPKSKSLALKKSKVQKLIGYYRDLGWNPTKKEEVKKKVKDIKYINYIRSKYETRLKVKSNKLQRYFRPQVDF